MEGQGKGPRVGGVGSQTDPSGDGGIIDAGIDDGIIKRPSLLQTEKSGFQESDRFVSDLNTISKDV